MPPGETIETSVHAKVNLALSVGPPVPAGQSGAGYHPICSWMVCVDLRDRLRVERLGDGGAAEFDIAWDDGSPVGWETADDLGARAHALLEEQAGRTLPARVTLRKSIPAGGGLGGGSADAAGVLRAVDALFSLGLGTRGLARLAPRLGSDVAFFLDDGDPPRPAVVSGLGDEIARAARVGGDITLVCPPFGCATGEVYRAYDRAPNGLRREVVGGLAGAPALEPAALFNDLTAAAERVEPRLAELRARLGDALGAPVHMSGSGSTLFVLGGVGVAECAAAAAPECRVIPARLV